MTPRAYATIAVALGSLLLALSLQLLYLGVLGHLADGQLPYHMLLPALAVALAGVAGSWFLVARRTLRTLESLETSPERRRVEWLAAPRKLTLALAGLWLMGGCGVSMWVIRRGIPRELIDHLVVSLTLTPALLGAAGAFFSVEELARASIAAHLPGGRLERVRLSLRTRVLVILVGFTVAPITALGLAFEHAVDEHEASMARAGMIAPHRDDDEGHGGLWLLCAAGGILMLGLGTFAARSVSTPIAALTAAMERVRAGDLATRVPVVSEDELGRASETFNSMVEGLSEREWLQETFGRYVSHEVAGALKEGKIALAGEVRRVTVLFSDIRNFTGISEKMEPRVLLAFMNAYLDAMIDAVAQHSGRVDKVMGDGLMVVFGAPLPDADQCRNALRAAQAMRRVLRWLNAGRENKGTPELRIGIGIHTGDVVAGNVGCAKHKLEYTVLGDAVNVASRLEGLTKSAGVDLLITEEVAREVGSDFEVTPVGELLVRGREQRVRTFTIP